ncbi:MAG: nucleoside hydrolase [Acidobacteriia bacterium]|nr:nucleoside hydrolase [Terriglobia bacterium]
MQFQGQGKPPIGIAFDSDLGNGIEDALALAMLYGFEGKGEARLISTSTTKSCLRAAAFCEALAKFYTPAPPGGGPFASFQRPAPPIGMADNGKMAEDTAVVKAVLEKKTPDGKPVYPYTIQKMNDTADPVALIRNAFTAQNDENCVMLLAGPATSLVKVLDLPGAVDLIKRKVKFLAVAAGSFPDGRADFNVKTDMASAKRLFAEWPTPIVAAGAEVGAALPFPGSSIEKDFAWAPDHPIVDAYRAFHRMPYDAPAPSMAAMLYAVHPDGYFKLSDPGTIGVLEDGRTKFTPSPEGRHRYLIVDPAQREKVIQTYVEMASAKPTVRAPRFRGGKKNVDPPKAADPVKKQ